MSISLVLVPVALTLRVVMGKERFESWVDSLQLKIPTQFANRRDLLKTIRKAGYDAEDWGGSIKTHLRGEQLFFFWEEIDGVWTAVFAKNDSRSEIKRFIRDLEKQAGRQIFQWNEQGQQPVTLPSKTFPTNFRDGKLLTQTLEEYGLGSSISSDGGIHCQSGSCKMVFRQSGDAPYRVEVFDPPDVREIYSHLDNINDGYCQSLQAKTYENLKSRIADRGLTIEQEEVQTDNSIVITLNVQS